MLFPAFNSETERCENYNNNDNLLYQLIFGILVQSYTIY